MYLVCALLVFLFSYLYLHRVKKFKDLNSLPGPPGLPIIGNLFDTGTSTTEVLENLQRYSKQYGEIYKLWIGPFIPNVVVCDAKSMESILSSTTHIRKSTTYDIFHSFLGDGLISSKGDEKWRKHRKLLTPAFHFKILETFIDAFQSLGTTLVEKLDAEVGNVGFDIYPYISRYTLDVICQTSMGLKLGIQDNPNHEYLLNLADYEHKFTMRQYSVVGRNENLYRYMPQYKNWSVCVNKIKFFTEDVIKKKYKQWESKEPYIKENKGKMKEPLLDLLFGEWKKGEITMEEIREELDTFMFAGHDTTSSAISCTLFELAKHRDIQDKILTEIKEVIGENDDDPVTVSNLSNLKYLETVCKETMRIYTTVPFIEREVNSYLELGGKIIPEGTTITLFLYGLHNSEKYYKNAHKFDPDRFSPENILNKDPYSYVPFSAGPRNCIGQRFAMLEVKGCIVKVIRNFILHPVEPEHKLQLGTNLILKSANGIPIRLERRL